MQVANPLVPPPVGQPGAAPAPVANAPQAQGDSKPETERPVSASKEAERPQAEDERRPRESEREREGRAGGERGGHLDIAV